MSARQLQMPPKYALASLLCSFGGLLFGIDTGIIGPVTVMTAYVAKFGPISSTVHGLIVSSILIPAAISSFFAGRVADFLGRPKGISLGALIFGVGAALEASAATLAMFIVGRCIEGLGEGLYLGNLVVYICEISPPSKRGPLSTGPQLLITLGLVVGFFTCYGSNKMDPAISWRFPFILLAGLSMIFSVSCLLMLPHSPRWLKERGHPEEAAKTWEFLGVRQAEREKVEVEEDKQTPAKSKFWALFSKDVRARTALAVFMMGMQQLSGIDGVLYYAPLLFQQAGLTSSDASFFASGVSAIVIFLATIPAAIYADKWGRRHSTIYGGIGLGLVTLLIGGLYAGHQVHGDFGAGRWVVIVSIYVFAVIYSVSWGVGIKIYAAEIQPQQTRAAATSLAHGSNWSTNFLVALVTPVVLAKSSFGIYFLFGGCSLLTSFVCAISMPETRGKSLEEIEEAFKRRPSASKRPRTLRGLIERVGL